MTTATQDYVAQRLLPIESRVRELGVELERATDDLLSKDAAIRSLEERLDVTEKELKQVREAQQAGGPDEKKSRSVTNNPAFRNLDCYTGDHAKFSRWRSRLRGIVVGEEEKFGLLMKFMESPHQSEIVSRADNPEAYEEQLLLLAKEMNTDQGSVIKISRQMHSILTGYCDGGTLSS